MLCAEPPVAVPGGEGERVVGGLANHVPNHLSGRGNGIGLTKQLGEWVKITKRILKINIFLFLVAVTTLNLIITLAEESSLM